VQYRADLLQDAASILRPVSQLKLSRNNGTNFIGALIMIVQEMLHGGYCANGQRLVETVNLIVTTKLKKLDRWMLI